MPRCFVETVGFFVGIAGKSPGGEYTLMYVDVR
nr:MAG TPA: hypothetical protein [Caudoviricetes sp.]